MFNAIFRHAQATVEQTIDNALWRVAMAVPFVIAAGFGTAALSLRLTRVYGAETAMTMMAGGFAVIGLVVAIYLSVSKGRHAPVEVATEAPQQSAENPEAATEARKPMSEAEWELTLAALTAALPVALPGIIRLALRNVPLLAAIAGAFYLLSRAPRTGGSDGGTFAAEAANNDNANLDAASVAAE